MAEIKRCTNTQRQLSVRQPQVGVKNHHFFAERSQFHRQVDGDCCFADTAFSAGNADNLCSRFIHKFL